MSNEHMLVEDMSIRYIVGDHSPSTFLQCSIDVSGV